MKIGDYVRFNHPHGSYGILTNNRDFDDGFYIKYYYGTDIKGKQMTSTGSVSRRDLIKITADEFSAYLKENSYEAKYGKTPEPLKISDAPILTFSESAQQPSILFHGSPPMVLTISNNGEELVTIDEHGTVTLKKEGAAPEAAKIFWDCVSAYYATAVRERNALKQELDDIQSAAEDRRFD